MSTGWRDDILYSLSCTLFYVLGGIALIGLILLAAKYGPSFYIPTGWFLIIFGMTLFSRRMKRAAGDLPISRER